MTFEATVTQIRALLDLAGLDQALDRPPSGGRRAAREVVARRVPLVLLERYELLLAVGRTPVVVAIDRGTCSGCHMRLPTMVDQRARRSPALHTCPQCRRMLYAPELVRERSDVAEGKLTATK